MELLLYEISVLLAFAIIGAGLKIIDLAFDEKIFPKKNAKVLAVLTATLMSALITLNRSAFNILTSLVLGVLLTKKVDNVAFRIGAIIVLIIAALNAATYITSIERIVLLGALTFAAVADEVINDWTDQKKLKPKSKTEHIVLQFGVLKLSVLMAVLTGFLNSIGFFGLLLLDGMYFEVSKLNTQEKWKKLWIKLRPSEKSLKA